MGKGKAGLIVAGLILLAGGGWYLSQNRTVKVAADDAKNEIKEIVQEGKETVSMKDLLLKGEDMKCGYTSSTPESGTAEVTVYVSGKKMRTDSTGVSSEGIAFSSSMILDGDYMYVWEPKQTEGIKMPVNKSKTDTEQWKGSSSYLDPEQKVDYKCGSWKADASLFELPAGVKFNDMTQILTEQCKICEKLSGEQKDTCQKSLGCK